MVSINAGLGVEGCVCLLGEMTSAPSYLRSAFHLGLFALALFTVSAAASTPPPEEAPLVKVGEYHLKYARQGAVAVVLGESIYVFGGNAGGAITFVERFNTRTFEVEALTDHLQPRRYHSVLEHNGKFFLFGGEGYGLPGNPLEYAVEIYDPATDQISSGPSMPVPRSGMAAVKLGNLAYFFGGSKLKGVNRAQTNDTDVFDFTTGKWGHGVPMPTPRESQAVVVGDFILVPGGYRSPRGVANVEMFVPQENVWKALPPLFRRTSAHSLVFFGDKLFLFGDFDDLDSVLSYNLRTRQSQKFNMGFKGGRHTSAVVCGDRIYVVGGNRTTESGAELDLIQVFAANPKYPGN